MATEAATRLHGLSAGRAALLDYDRAAYAATGELTGYVWIDGVMLNLVLVSEGYAVHRPGTTTSAYDAELLAAQRSAAAEGAGLWSRCPSAAT
jgi:micrococcal nuclease